ARRRRLRPSASARRRPRQTLLRGSGRVAVRRWRSRRRDPPGGAGRLAWSEADQRVAGPRERVLDAEPDGERIAGLRVDDVLHHHSTRLALADAPWRPAGQTVNRVGMRGLGERELV